MVNEDFCASLEIPHHLSKNGRLEDQIFLLEEKIYRWFAPKDSDGESYILKDPNTGEEVISTAIFRTDGMSCVREKFIKELKDVLYNIKSKEHFFDFGIVEFEVEKIEVKVFEHPTIAGTKYSLKLVHRPEECLYPHSEVQVLENEIAKSDIKPSSIRTKVKAEYQRICKIVKRP